VIRNISSVTRRRPQKGDIVIDRLGVRYEVTLAGLKYLHVRPVGGGPESILYITDATLEVK
jgi:hypothetical protein